MKTLEQFVKDNEGQFLEVAGSSNAKFQCVDCVNGYIRDVLGFPIIEWTNAIDFKNKANGNYEIIYNDINNSSLVPNVGDIVVYKHPNNIGHIGFCIRKGTALTFGIFEENWPVGSPCKSVLNKKYILGDYVVDYWMRPKSVIISDMTDEQKRILDFLNGKSEGDVRQAFGALQDLAEKDKQIQTLTNKVHELELQMVEVNTALDEIKSNFIEKDKEVLSWQKKYNTASTNLSEQILKNEELDKLAKDNKNLYLKKNDDFNNLSNIFEEYKKTHPDEIPKCNIINFIKSLFKK